jgi:SWI/SNF-related matrix-associated actin-dependent regulator of chromatin subfamily A member 5
LLYGSTLLTTVAREFGDAAALKPNSNGKRQPEDDENDENSVLGMAPAKKKSKNGVKVRLNIQPTI